MGRKRKRSRSRSSDYDRLKKEIRRIKDSLKRHRRRTPSTSSSEDDRSAGDGYRDESPPRRHQQSGISISYSDDDAQDGGEEQEKEVRFDEEASGKDEAHEGLDPEILQMLGEDPSEQKSYGENLHKDIAARWAHILTNGLQKEAKSELLKQYLPSENCTNMKAPILNPEIKAALTDLNNKKDLYSQSKQNQLSSCLAAIAKALNWALSTKDPQAQNVIKPLSDAGRLLCDSHYRESQSRRYAIINTLNKQIRDTVKNTKLDEYLFGANLADHLKSSKAILKSGSEMKSTIQRAPFKQTPTTQRGALNSKGTTRSTAGEPRPNYGPRKPTAAPRDRRYEPGPSYRRPPPSRQRSRRRY